MYVYCVYQQYVFLYFAILVLKFINLQVMAPKTNERISVFLQI